GQNFDSDPPLHERMLGGENDAHGPGPQSVEHPVVSQDKTVRCTCSDAIKLVLRQEAGLDQRVSQGFGIGTMGQPGTGMFEKLSYRAGIKELLINQAIEKVTRRSGQDAVRREISRPVDEKCLQVLRLGGGSLQIFVVCLFLVP